MLRVVAVAALTTRPPELLLSRRFPNVELRCAGERGQAPAQLRQTKEGDSSPVGHEADGVDEYAPLPPDAELLSELVCLWAATPHEDTALADPVCFRVHGVWPVVCSVQGSYLLYAVPGLTTRVHATGVGSPIDHPEITVTMVFLNDFGTFARQLFDEDPRELYEKLAELNLHLSFAAPFGRLQDQSLQLTRSLCRNPAPGDKQATTNGPKLPPWKPYLVRGKNQLNFIFREEIDAVQYDHPQTPNTWQVHGVVLCKAELEGAPDVTVPLQAGSVGMLTALAVHSCVQAEELTQVHQLVFSPPSDTFPLCTYRVLGVPSLPLRGFYQMKELDATSVKILVQLKLEDRFHNNFEYCQVHLPFTARGQITQLDVSPTTGVVSLSPSRLSLIWNIGQRFAGKSREVALPGVVFFKPQTTDKPISSTAAPMTTTNGSTRSGSGNAMGTTISMAASDGTKGTDGKNEVAANANTPNAVVARPDRDWNSFAEPEEGMDRFCAHGETAYASVRFKLLENNLSGCTMDPQSVVIYPNAKVKVTVQRELVAGQYLIWNSKGDSRHATPPPTALPSL